MVPVVLDAMVAVIVELLRWGPQWGGVWKVWPRWYIDGRNPAITTWDVQNLVNNPTNDQPQLVSRISEPSPIVVNIIDFSWETNDLTLYYQSSSSENMFCLMRRMSTMIIFHTLMTSKWATGWGGSTKPWGNDSQIDLHYIISFNWGVKIHQLIQWL